MGSTVPYNKQTLDTPNPIARFAQQARYRFSVIKVLQHLKPNGVLLDYGCGDGTLLHKIAVARPQAVLYGFDPESDQNSESYNRINTVDILTCQSVNVVCCFEVLEHLYAHERERFYADVKRTIAIDGIVVISVPVIGGPTLLLKEFNRRILFKRRSDYSIKELLASSFLGVSAPRPENLRWSHKGFDFKVIKEELSKEFKMIENIYSPFPLLPWFFNSQLFIVLSV